MERVGLLNLFRKSVERRAFRLSASLHETMSPDAAGGPLRHVAPSDLVMPRFIRRERRTRNEALYRSLCSPVYVGNGTALCRVLGRYKILVDAADCGHSAHLLLEGFWEMAVTEAMRAALRPGMNAIDVGANLGYFALLMADLVGERGRVHAVEPNPSIASRLRRSVEMNGFAGRTAVHEVPLSDLDGQEMMLVVPDGEPKNAALRPPAEAASFPGARHAVWTRRLDTLLGDAKVDFVKIDAEGLEEAIWRGMRGLLDRRSPLTVFLEFRTDRYGDPAGFVAELLRDGFALARIDPEHGVLPTTPEEVLRLGRLDDVMLALRR